jgi:uncharacterized membrane protein
VIGLKKRAVAKDADDGASGTIEDERYTLGRLLEISDNVFAFSLTLMVVFLVVPSVAAVHTSAQLTAALANQWTTYLSYGLSFFAIYISWNGHQRIFRQIRRCDARLVQLNFGLLLFVALLPFPTAIVGEFGQDPIAAVLYAVMVSFIGLIMAAIWLYAVRGRRLVAPGLTDQQVRRQMLVVLRGPAIFLLTIPLALWRPQVAEFSWLFIWFAISIIRTTDRELGKRRP